MADTVTDVYLQHQVSVSQYAKGEIRNILRSLERMQSNIIADLTTKASLSNMRTIKLKQELKVVNRAIRESYENIGAEYAESSAAFKLQESGWQSTALSRLSATEVPILSFSEISRGAGMDRFEGKVFSQHLTGLSKKSSLKLRQTIIEGVSLGRSNIKIVKTLMPLFRIEKRDLKAIVRTGIQANSASVRDSYFRKYNNIVRQGYWAATLDGRTTKTICAPRDGLQYTVPDHTPKFHGMAWIGGPPAHWNCRSAFIPIVVEGRGTRPAFDFNKETGSRATSTIRVETSKTGRTMRKAQKGARLGANQKRMGRGGQVPGDLNFKTWFRDQPEWFQESYLGKTKAKLYRKGGLTLDKFSEGVGRELTLKELESLFPNQWASAFGAA